MTEVQISTLKGGTIALSNDILTALQLWAPRQPLLAG